eukprot:Gb_04778 [translate_table: standard]
MATCSRVLCLLCLEVFFETVCEEFLNAGLLAWSPSLPPLLLSSMAVTMAIHPFPVALLVMVSTGKRSSALEPISASVHFEQSCLQDSKHLKWLPSNMVVTAATPPPSEVHIEFQFFYGFWLKHFSALHGT